MDREEIKNSMAGIFIRSGFPLPPSQAGAFAEYYRLLLEYNEECDLTRIRGFEEIVVRHFIDSIYVTRLCGLPSPLLDIGTGAGFPGIPLKIIAPELKIILAEPRRRRVEFLNLVIERLGLDGIEVHPHMVTEDSFFDVGGVITRALESIDETLSRVNPFLPAGGRVLFMKGPKADEDVRALSPASMEHFRMAEDREYLLPGTNYGRRILVFEKTSPLRRMTYKIFRDGREAAGSFITSEENRRFREMKKLVTVEGIKKSGKVLVPGKKLVRETVKNARHTAEALVLPDGYSDSSDGMNALISGFAEKRALYILKKSLYNELDIFHTGAPLLLTGVSPLPEWDGSLAEGCNLLLPFQDPANVGSIIRSAAGFGVNRIILLREAAHPFHPKCVRASGGAVLSADLFHGPSLAELGDMRDARGWDLIALDRGGEPISGFRFPETFLLLPGVEGPGVPEALKARSLSIPIGDAVESLNAAVAASIALFAWRSRKE